MNIDISERSTRNTRRIDEAYMLRELTRDFECSWPNHEWRIETDPESGSSVVVLTVNNGVPGLGMRRKVERTVVSIAPLDHGNPAAFVDALVDAIESVGLAYRLPYKVDTGPARDFRIATRGQKRLRVVR